MSTNPFAVDPYELAADRDDVFDVKLSSRLTAKAPKKEQTAAGDGVSCSNCGKKLRSNNKRGLCAVGSGCGGKITRGDHEVVNASKPRLVTPPAPVSQGGGGSPVELTPNEALERFRRVTTALGVDGDELLGTFAAKWLSELQAWVGKS